MRLATKSMNFGGKCVQQPYIQLINKMLKKVSQKHAMICFEYILGEAKQKKEEKQNTGIKYKHKQIYKTFTRLVWGVCHIYGPT